MDKYLKILLIIVISVAGILCLHFLQPLDPSLDAIKKKGELVVLTRKAPTTYYVERNGETAGFEHDMAKHFARWLGVSVRFKLYDSVGEIIKSLEKGKGHLAAAGLTGTERRAEIFEFGPPYYEVQQQLVCRRGGNRPQNIEDLDSVSLAVVKDSSHDERLCEIRGSLLPDLAWESIPGVSQELLLEMVWRGELDCTVADSNVVAKNRRFYPDLVVVLPLTDLQELVWLLPKGAKELSRALDEWFAVFEESGGLSTLTTRYYAHVEVFDYVDIVRFAQSVEERLPQYRPLFEEAAEKYGFEWTLLAALAYQESHWDPRARSSTGVRGIMMITLDTAKELGIDDRLDVGKSIEGGARYLAELHRRLPESIEEPDRTWIALAAYNVGMGHIYDARALADLYGLDKDTWAGLREVLPKLSQPDYYNYLRFGYARGQEPVVFVARIRNYKQILEHHLWNQVAGETTFRPD